MGLWGGAKRRVMERADRAGKRALLRGLALATRDVTARVATTSCVVLAPHPDDETLGCGALIARKTSAGAAVWVAFASLGTDSHRSRHLTSQQLGEIRRAEAREACRRLGVAEERVLFLSEVDRIATAAAPIAAALGALLDTARPDELYVVSGLDEHPDHAALNAIVTDRLASGAIACPVYEYPVWFWADRQAARRWLAGVGRTIAKVRDARGGYLAPVAVSTDGFLAQKRRALAAHATQVTRYRTDEPWSTLQDIDDSRWLERFFGPHELFFPRG